jgi:hypothetical protein
MAPYKESIRARITKLWLLSALSHKLDKITTKLLLKSFLPNILQNDLAPLAREVTAPHDSEPKSFKTSRSPTKQAHSVSRRQLSPLQRTCTFSIKY